MIGILDYGMGNLSSVANALDYIGAKNCIISSCQDFKNVSKLIIPGVGSFAQAMSNLHYKGFVKEILDFNSDNKPILGICLGMQLLAEFGTEPIESEGIGLINGKVLKLFDKDVRVPHVGWNNINLVNNHPIMVDVKTTADFYFVHSYYFSLSDPNNLISETDYGLKFPSIVTNTKGNVVGIQFHPEKSQKQGLKILDNFSSWNYA